MIEAESGSFPFDFKIGKVTALHKSGGRSHILNYRSVSVLAAKIIEKAVHDQLSTFLKQNNF